MNEELPDAVAALIGRPQYEQDSEFPIEMGYVYNTCAATKNANPLFWDNAAAESITRGQIAPPTMLSVWFRPHYWAPGAEEERTPLQAHFDLKRLLDLPEAIISENETVFGAPVRMGDRLHTRQIVRSISPIKTTKLGSGRFWVVEVEYTNQRGEFVGTDTYTAFGYRRGAAA
jgi:acyl dehydratase